MYKRMILIMGLLTACQPQGLIMGGAPPVGLTTDVDRVAAYILDKTQARSFANDREYCGLIGYDKKGKLFATSPNRGGQNRCLPRVSPAMTKVVASYHTHGAAAPYIDTEAPSPEDLFADLSEHIDGYVATPGGRLWKVDHNRKAAYLICPKGCVRRDPEHKECKQTAPEGYQTRRSLEERQFLPKTDCGAKTS